MGLDVSVIVPTCDRPNELERMLASLTRGSFPPERYEVIVADNGRSPATGPVVERWRDRFSRLVRVAVPKPGLHEARHAGWRVAGAELLVFADDDIVAGERWLESIREGFGEADVALIGGNNLPLFEAPPPRWLERLWQTRVGWGRCIYALSVLDFGPAARDIPPEFVFGCNFAVRKSVLQLAGGFHPDGFPPNMLRFRGDGETHVSAYVTAAGFRARLIPGASVEHAVPAGRMTGAYFARRYFAQGVSDSYSDFRAGIRRSLRARWRMWARLPRPLPLLVHRWRWHAAYWQGYRFHRVEVARDSALLEWVRKDTYV